MDLPDFKNPPKAIAVDLDGTLLNSKTELSARNHKALEKCISAGIPVIIATSRPARIFNRIFPWDLAAACSLIIMNGAIAIGKGPLSGYFKEDFPEGIVQNIIDNAMKSSPGVRITIELDGYDFGINWFNILDRNVLWQRNSATIDMVLTIEEALKRQPSKIALGGAGIDFLELAETLRAASGSSLSIVPSLIGNPMLNITSAQATKSIALRKLLDPAGIALDAVLAFGDDYPDIGMLRDCGIPVAMANAFPEVKEVCPYLTSSNDEDGVAQVLEKFV
jgi:Cof subfamily protein (haloacid dehalogenase superfamily)